MKRTLDYASLLKGICILPAVVTLVLYGCNTLANLNIVNPRYSIHDVRPRVDIAIPLSASTIDLDFDLGIENPNPVGLRLDRVDFDLLVNDSHVLRSVSDQRIRIPARGSGDVLLRTHIGYNDIRTMFREVANIIQGNRARYEIRGNAYYDTPAGQLRFPLTVYSTAR